MASLPTRAKSPTRARRRVRLSEVDGYYQLDLRVRRRQPDPAGPIAIGLLPLWVRPVGDESARVCIARWMRRDQGDSKRG